MNSPGRRFVVLRVREDGRRVVFAACTTRAEAELMVSRLSTVGCSDFVIEALRRGVDATPGVSLPGRARGARA
jgi:hypothetical protein